MGALLARNPSHYKGYTVVGISLLGLTAGIGGGVARDMILNKIPAALESPFYIPLCLVASFIALEVHYRAGQRLRDGTFKFMAAFSLPWYAAVGVNAAITAGLPFYPSILIGIIGPTTGRFIVDIVSGVTPKHFVKGEWFVGTAVLTSVVYYLSHLAGLSLVPATLIAFAVGFTFRILALSRHWEEPVPWEPTRPEKQVIPP